MKQLVYSPQSLGNAIRRQRKLKQLNQSDAGKPFKIEQTTFSDVERGAEGTRVDTLFRILAALDLEMIIQTKKKHAQLSNEEW
jgi:HTH-type transcriptional regulator/antitoxin HipB